MVIKTASPGIVVQEVDLTRGSSDAITENVACLAGAFQKGPVDQIIRVSEEVEFVDTFGLPTDENYEYWFTVDNFLEYSGECYVVRVDDAPGGTQTMRNAHDGEDQDQSGNEIRYYVKNDDDYYENYQTAAGIGSLPGKFIARNPGAWANGLAVAVIDRGADFQNTLDVDFRKDTAGNDIVTTTTFNQTLPVATNVGSYVKVAAAAETIVAPTSWVDATVRSANNIDITVYPPFSGGSVVAASTTNIDRMVARGAFTDARVAVDVETDIAVRNPFGADVRLVSDANIDISIGGDGQTIAGETAAGGDRILLINQTSSVENGIYDCNGSGAWTRSSDADDSSEFIQGTLVTVTAGTNAGLYEYLSASNPSLGVDNIAFTPFTYLSTLDGVALNDGDKVLLVEQDDPSENGLYTVDASAGYSRDASAAAGSDFTTGKLVSVTEGSYAGMQLEYVGQDNPTLGSDTILFDNFTWTPQVDGVNLNDGDRVLVKDNTDNTENGIYEVNDAGVWVRAADASASGDFVTGSTVVVTNGASGQGTYQYTGTDNPTVGTDPITFATKSYLPDVDGVALSGGERVLLTGQTDATENGIYLAASTGWTRTTDADDSANFVNGKTVDVLGGDNFSGVFQFVYDDLNGTNPFTLGTDPVAFAPYAPITRIAVGEGVQEFDENGDATGAFGVVMSISNGVYKIISLAKDADDKDILFSAGNTLSKNNGTTNTGAISDVEYLGQHIVYSYGDTDELDEPIDDRIVNTIWVSGGKTYEEGKKYGWPAATNTGKQRTPIDGERVTSALGTLYMWNAATQRWAVQYNIVDNEDLLYDGTYLFQIDRSDDWYQQQIAFDGIPWFRFAGRPGSSPNALDKGSGADEMHLIVYDSTGDLTGSKGNTLENYYSVSKNSGALTPEGGRNYYIEVVNRTSQYLFANTDVDGPKVDEINQALNALEPGQKFETGRISGYIDAMSYFLGGGVDQLEASLGEIQVGYQKFIDENVEDLDYVLQGPSMYTEDDSVAKANFIISIAEAKRDCMSFITPPRYATLDPLNAEVITDETVNFANKLSSSSYAVFDSGYKYQYDRFNDKYRYVAMNGDVAGLLAATAFYNEPWYSPAGLQRGQIRNVVKLGYNPSKEQRDQLFSARVNPIVTFPGDGTVLYGDKTALTYSSAFDRINVRKLFLILEREITQISRNVLFEFNDSVTRNLFTNNVAPFLRDVQSRRGLQDYLVVCDESNNTPEVIDRNEFVADIYIKPNRSINFVSLNFVATKTGVSFGESVAMFRGAQI